MKVKLIIIASFLLTITLNSQILSQEDPFRKAREKMVKRDLKGRDINDEKVLSAMGKVKRHLFVDKDRWHVAYNDYPLSIGEGQTISQPYIVALMTQCLNLKPEDKVLEIGTGSGYQAAVLAELVNQVYSIELNEKLAKKSSRRLQELGYKNVTVTQGDGYFGWPEHAPFDAVIITCAANDIPPLLIDQLKEDGRLIMPLGNILFHQTLTLITKVKGEKKVEHISGVRFVPMRGEAEKR
jgi:protein-L-isoaspartate(D-aspartate) O-methyltransferase